MTAITKRLGAAHDWKAEMEAKKAFLRELIMLRDNQGENGATIWGSWLLLVIWL